MERNVIRIWKEKQKITLRSIEATKVTMSGNSDDDEFKTVCNNTEISQAYRNYFRNLCFKRTFSDLTLVCGGITFSCHKAILWSQSIIFKELIDFERTAEVIILTNISPIHLKRLLCLIYCGEVHLPSKQAGEFISLLPEWGIESQLEVIPKTKVEGNHETKVNKGNDKETSTTTTLENIIIGIEEKHQIDQKVFMRRLFDSGISFKSDYCSLCLLSFSSSLQYQDHQRKHIYAKENIFTPLLECPLCSSKFYSKEPYEKHLLSLDHITSKHVFQPYVSIQINQSVDYLASKMREENNYCCKKGETEVESDSPSPDDVSVQCPVCFKDILTPSLLPSHLQLHTSGHKFECCYCFSGFENKLKLSDHQKIHKNKKPYVCLTCKARFRYSSELTSHFIESRHKKTSIKAQKSLNSSKKTNRKLSVELEKLLIRLSKKVRPNQEPAQIISPRLRYECPLCFINLGCNKESFFTHIKLHSTESKTCCQYCFTDLCSEEALVDHIVHVHQDKSYHCPKGDFCADTHSAVLLHFETSYHESMNSLNLETLKAIQIENKSYGQDKLLQVQITRQNDDNELSQPMEKSSVHKVFKSSKDCNVCSVCCMELEGERSLKNHQKIHITGFPLECRFCLMGFIQKDKMEKHKILHENFYECQYCSEEFENYVRFIKHFEDSSHHTFYRQSFTAFSQLFPIPTKVAFISDSAVAEITNIDAKHDNLPSEPEEGPIPSSSIFIEDEVCNSPGKEMVADDGIQVKAVENVLPATFSDTDESMLGQKIIISYSSSSSEECSAKTETFSTINPGLNSPFLSGEDDGSLSVSNQNKPYLEEHPSNKKLNNSLQTILTDAFLDEITEDDKSENVDDISNSEGNKLSSVAEDISIKGRDKHMPCMVTPVEENNKYFHQRLPRRSINMFHRQARIKFYEKKKFGKYNTTFLQTKKTVPPHKSFDENDPYKLDTDSASITPSYSHSVHKSVKSGNNVFQYKKTEIAEPHDLQAEQVVNPTCPKCFKFLLNKEKMKQHMTICERRENGDR